MRNFLSVFAIMMLLSVQPLLAQEQDSTQVEEAAQDAEQAIDQAEEFAERNLNFGLRAGLNFSTLNSDEGINSDPKTGVSLGLFTRYQFSRSLSAKVELLYSMMGARDDAFSNFEDYAVNLNYLTIPILAEFMPVNNFRIELGPYFGVLLSSRQSFGALLPPEDVVVIETSEDDVSSVDVGFAIGATYEFSSGFGLGARYTQGFANALGTDFFGGASGANTSFQTALYYTF